MSEKKDTEWSYDLWPKIRDVPTSRHMDVERFSLKRSEITQLRTALGVTQEELGALIDCSWSTIARIEGNGKPAKNIAIPIVGIRDTREEAARVMETSDLYHFYGLPFEDERVPDWPKIRPADILKMYGGRATVRELLKRIEAAS